MIMGKDILSFPVKTIDSGNSGDETKVILREFIIYCYKINKYLKKIMRLGSCHTKIRSRQWNQTKRIEIFMHLSSSINHSMRGITLEKYAQHEDWKLLRAGLDGQRRMKLRRRLIRYHPIPAWEIWKQIRPLGCVNPLDAAQLAHRTSRLHGKLSSFLEAKRCS